MASQLSRFLCRNGVETVGFASKKATTLKNNGDIILGEFYICLLDNYVKAI